LSPRATPWGAYKQIADSLRGRITRGELTPGDTVPSESALGQEFGVARSTVRRALAALEADGLIRPLPGTGRVVCSAEEQKGTAVEALPAQYRQIAAELKERINSGDLAPGDALPSEAAIVRRYGVSRGTVRQALSELEGSGLIIAVHGKGRFVRRPGTTSG